MPSCWSTSACFTSRRRSSRMLLSSKVPIFAVLLTAAVAAGQTQPDLAGMYTRNGVVGLEAQPPENPIDPSGKNPLSVSTRAGDELGPYPKVFGQGGAVLRGNQARQQRRTGIVDPADRKLPWKPEEDAKRREFLIKRNPAAGL